MQPPRIIEHNQSKLTRRLLLEALAVNTVAAASVFPFYTLSKGEKTHAEGWFASLLCLAVIGIIPSVMIFSVARTQGVFTRLGLIDFLGITPLPLAMALVAHAKWLRGFIIQ